MFDYFEINFKFMLHLSINIYIIFNKLRKFAKINLTFL